MHCPPLHVDRADGLQIDTGRSIFPLLTPPPYFALLLNSSVDTGVVVGCTGGVDTTDGVCVVSVISFR